MLLNGSPVEWGDEVEWGEEFVPDPGMPFGSVDPFLDPGVGSAFGAFPTIFGLFFLVAVGVVVFRMVQAAGTHATNAALPEQTVSARVVAKRTRTEGGGNDTMVRTLCFVTFEQDGGDRIEMKVSGREFGQLAEGDRGHLTHQGSWFRRFERDRMPRLDGTWEPPAGPSLPPPP